MYSPSGKSSVFAGEEIVPDQWDLKQDILERRHISFRYSFFKIRTSFGASLISAAPWMRSSDSISI